MMGARRGRRFLVAAGLLLLLFPPAGNASAKAVLWPDDALTKVMRSDLPPESADRPLQISAARGEIVSAQAVFRCDSSVAKVAAAISDLLQKDGAGRINASAAHLQWVRYIDITRNTAGIPPEELIAQAPASIPDPFWEASSIAVTADRSQPLWLEIHVPTDAAAGDYTAILSATADGETLRLPVMLHVWDFDVPAQRHLAVINWWRFPGLGFEGIKPYSDQYWSLLADSCRFLVAHRQTDIQTSLGLIRENGSAQDDFTYDTTALEKYAETAFTAGVERIHLHSVGTRTLDLTNPESRIGPNEPNLRRLAAWEKVIRLRKWNDRFLVSISDEPFIHHEESYAAMVDRVHAIAPDVRCIEAVETEYLGDLDVYVPKLSHLNLWYPNFKKAQDRGAQLWFYTCCHPVGRYPNRFLDQSLLKTRVLHWIDYLYDLDGYLHWGLNQFAGSDPYTEEGISKDLPLGDRAIAYPGTRGLLGSLRFSAMRDGLQDYEYLWVLEHTLADIKAQYGPQAHWLDPRQRPLELCRRVIQSFHEYTRDPQCLLDTRTAIAREIEALKSDPLLVVQTSPPEGAAIPAGPRNVGVRGLVRPGAKVTINGRPVLNVRPDGYFLQAIFVGDKSPTVTISVEEKGNTRTVQRNFILTD